MYFPLTPPPPPRQRIEPEDIRAMRQLEEMHKRCAEIYPLVKKLADQINESLRHPWRR